MLKLCAFEVILFVFRGWIFDDTPGARLLIKMETTCRRIDNVVYDLFHCNVFRLTANKTLLVFTLLLLSSEF